MAGYATMSPALAFGPPGWAAWAVVGTVVTVGTVWAGSQVYEMAKSEPKAEAKPEVIPKTKAKEDCNKRYTVRVHAQGVDCVTNPNKQGTSSSTIGVPALIKAIPVTVVEGLALSQGTWALLNRSQQKIRISAKEKADQYIRNGPKNGGYYYPTGGKTFPASDYKGGKRYDVDCNGTDPSCRSFVN